MRKWKKDVLKSAEGLSKVFAELFTKSDSPKGRRRQASEFDQQKGSKTC
jgi:hypothetical protein